jgi:hypothetical protein
VPRGFQPGEKDNLGPAGVTVICGKTPASLDESEGDLSAFIKIHGSLAMEEQTDRSM